MSHTLTIQDRRISSGEVRPADDVPPKMNDWWADFGLGDRGQIRPSAASGKRVETSGLFFLQEVTENLKRQPRPRPRVEMPKTPPGVMVLPPVLPSEVTLQAPRRSVWAIPAVLGAMVLVALVSALGTLWLTGRAGRPEPTAMAGAPTLAPGQRTASRTVVPPATERAVRRDGAQPSASPMAPPPAAPSLAIVVTAPETLDEPAVTTTAREDRKSRRKRRHRGMRHRQSSDRDADEDDPGSATPGYSLYATLGAANAAGAPRPSAPAAQGSGGVANEAVAQVRPMARPSETYRMLKVAAGGERRKPAARPSLPSRLPASAVTRALGRVRSGVQGCLRRFGFGHTTIRLRVTVSGSTGRVTAARALGRFRGAPAGRCALRLVRSLSFPRFSHASQTVLLPVRAR